MSVVSNAVILPLTREELLPQAVMSHGLVIGEGAPDYFGHFRKHKNVIDRRVQRARIKSGGQHLSGLWLYGGMLLPHFGHLLSECVHRLWAWRECGDCQGVLFVVPPKFHTEAMPAYVYDVLAYFGVHAKKIRFVFNNTVVEQLVVPEQLSGLGMPAVGAYNDFLAQLKAEHAPVPAPTKLFVSRRGYLEKGRLAGMDYLASMLHDCGYTEFTPQDHSFESQLHYISEAEKIIFEEGSAIHLLDALPRIKAQVFIIKRRPKYKLFDELLQFRCAEGHMFNDVLDAPPLTNAAHEKSNSLSFVTDLAALLNDLSRTGFAEVVRFSKADFIVAQKCDVFDFVMSRRAKDGFSERLATFLDFADNCIGRSEAALS